MFSGIQFAYATQGLCQFVTGGACPYGTWTPLPGNVSFGYDQKIQFLNDQFVHLGAAGLALGDGSRTTWSRSSTRCRCWRTTAVTVPPGASAGA